VATATTREGGVTYPGIYSHAEAEDDGEITNEAAKEAYSDVRNLVGMCRSCNSSKSGPKNKYD
jgi:hypothetical protein